MNKHSSRTLYILAILSILLSQVGVMPAAALVTFTVDTTTDTWDANPGDGICRSPDGKCSLRAAVMEANAWPGFDNITIPPGTYTISIPAAGPDTALTGDLDITEGVAISGAGMAQTIIDANHLDRVFHVLAGNLSLTDVTVQNGAASPGGGILLVNPNATTGGSTIRRVAFINNQTASTGSDATGGAIFVGADAYVTITASRFGNNSAYYRGGAVAGADDTSIFEITGSSFDANNSQNAGGAIYLGSQLSQIHSSTFTNNSADTGGAIATNRGGYVDNSTFVGNTATNGAAIDAQIGTLYVNYSTFSANQATVSGNTLSAQAGGIAVITGSILSGQTPSTTDNCSGTVLVDAYSLSWPAGNNCPGIQNDPVLLPLADNGGLTQTMALGVGSPAIDAVPSCLATDQRGVTRPQGPACDIGALEVLASPLQTGPTFSVNTTNDANIACTVASCSLREAILAANATPGANTIIIPAGDYILTIPGAGENAAATGDLDITKDVSVYGAGIGITNIIYGWSSDDRVLHVVSGTLSLFSVSVGNGRANPGGGLLVDGRAIVQNSMFVSNESGSTGPDGTGGAIFVNTGATAAISNTQFAYNFAYFGGGAIASASDPFGSYFSVTDSTFDHNSTHFGGGALYPNGSGAQIVGSTFTRNSADTGGAIHSNSANVDVHNSTFVGNTAVNDGAIDARLGTITVNNSTFSGNTATGSGNTFGAQSGMGGLVQVENSILSGPTTNNCSGSIADLGNNLSWPAGNNCPGSQADPLLMPLADNIGPTQTMALGVGSPAIDAGNDLTCWGYDQRGVTRPQGAHCDIGAFELEAVNVFTVTNTNDDGPGSLRQAIVNANGIANKTFGRDEIHFDIPGGGVQTIQPLTPLPVITDPVIIDGYTQPGASANTLASGTNAVLLIELNGNNNTNTGLSIQTSDSSVRGLVINGFTSYGIEITGPGVVRDHNRISGNYIGTNAAGTAAVPNGFGPGGAGIGVIGGLGSSDSTIIGGASPADRNVISGNGNAGIFMVKGVSHTTILGNYIGVASDGTSSLGNANAGIATAGAGAIGSVVGGTSPGEGNVIANNYFGVYAFSGSNNAIVGNTIRDNLQGGIVMPPGMGMFPAGTGYTFIKNSIGNNGGLGIDLGDDGPTFNHIGTAAGPNGYQNYPILYLATSGGTSLRLVGTLTSEAAQTYGIDVYSSPACDETSFGEGQTYLGTFTVSTDANGASSFDQTLAVSGVEEPQVITATATGPNGTSEFSYCLPVATTNLNWVQAQSVSGSSTTQQFITSRFQEKWFKFPVQPGDTVHVTLTGQPGSAISLHSDPHLSYNQLTNPQSAVALSAKAADNAFLPTGFMPTGFMPTGFMPTGFMPTGFMPTGFMPTGFMPTGFMPAGSLPTGFMPTGFMPTGFMPADALPTGFMPTGFMPTGFMPAAAMPVGSLPTGFMPAGSVPTGFMPFSTLPTGFMPSDSRDAYASAAWQSLMAVAADPDAKVQTVERATYDTSGDLYIRVVGPFSLTQPFSLQVHVISGTCGFSPVPDQLPVMSGSPQAGLQTLILTDSGRLKGIAAEISAALGGLQAIAHRGDVNGLVIDLHDTQYQRVAWANAQADQYPTCPAAKNMVAAEIKRVIDAYRTANGSSLQYIVLAGGANVVPFYQIPDVAGLANEKDYVPPVGLNTPSEAGLKYGQVQGQDYYGSQTDFQQGGLTIALPELAVGRLVDSAADISAAIQTYIGADGVISPQSSLVTGYDFVGDTARAIETEVTEGTGRLADTLIEDVGQPPSHGWTAAQLNGRLNAGNHDVIVLMGHFSAGNMLAADYSTQLAAPEVAASTANLKNALVLALGCHGGYAIPNSDHLILSDGTVQQDASPNPDWARAFLEKGASGYVAASGYAYGDTELQEYGERLFVDLAQQLRTGTGPITIGQALVAAKRQYIADGAQMTGIDQKTLVEMTLYGFPMMKVNFPIRRPAPGAQPSIVTGTTVFSRGPAASTGLTGAGVTLSPNTDLHTVSLTNVADNTTVQATYLSGRDDPSAGAIGGVIANPFEPIYPKQVYNVSVDTQVLRGVALYGGSYGDQTGVVPLTSAPATETSNLHLSFNADAFYPNQIWMPNFSDALEEGPTRLVTIPAQFRSSAPGAIDGTLRTFSQMQLKLYYLPANWPTVGSPSVKAAAVSPAPTILGVSAGVEADKVDFRVYVTTDGSAGVQEVWVLYTGRPGSTYYRHWLPLDLTQDANDPALWENKLTLPAGAHAQDLLFMVEAAGGAGLTSLSTNLGAYYKVAPANAGELPPPAETTIQLLSAPSSGTYAADSTFQVLLQSAGQPLTGQLVTFNIGGQQALATTDGSGHATASLKIMIPPGTYTAQASFPGGLNYLGSTTSQAFTVGKAGTQLQVSGSPDTVNAGDPTHLAARLLDSSGNALNGKSVFFVVHGSGGTLVRSALVDFQGNAALGRVALPAGTYTVDAYFSGTIPLNPRPLTLDDALYSSSESLDSSLTILPPIDTTLPSLAPTIDPNPILLNGTATIQPNATDDQSGIASASCGPLVTNSVGTKEVTCTATDNAGNVSRKTVSYNVVYRFIGFLQPVNDTARPQVCGSPCPISIFNGGSTIPVKFQLKDAYGSVVQSATLPVWIAPQKGSRTTAAVDEPAYSAPASGGGTYRLSADQYVYNWNTKGVATGYYWVLGVQLDDGQTYSVTIGLR